MNQSYLLLGFGLIVSNFSNAQQSAPTQVLEFDEQEIVQDCKIDGQAGGALDGVFTLGNNKELVQLLPSECKAQGGIPLGLRLDGPYASFERFWNWLSLIPSAHATTPLPTDNKTKHKVLTEKFSDLPANVRHEIIWCASYIYNTKPGSTIYRNPGNNCVDFARRMVECLEREGIDATYTAVLYRGNGRTGDAKDHALVDYHDPGGGGAFWFDPNINFDPFSGRATVLSEDLDMDNDGNVDAWNGGRLSGFYPTENGADNEAAIHVYDNYADFNAFNASWF